MSKIPKLQVKLGEILKKVEERRKKNWRRTPPHNPRLILKCERSGAFGERAGVLTGTMNMISGFVPDGPVKGVYEGEPG